MNCRQFEAVIPQIIDDSLPPEHLDAVLEHVELCKYCYDELELNYILDKGLSDEKNVRMDFVEQLNAKLEKMKRRKMIFARHKAYFHITQITAYTAVAGSLIYVIFNYFT